MPSNVQTASSRLTIQRTQTGYWTVHRGATQVAAAMTRRGAEAERELLRRLSRRSVRRAGRVRV